MKIEIDAKEGQRVWVIVGKPMDINCRGCGGSGDTKLQDGKDCDCPKCGGFGKEKGILDWKICETNTSIETIKIKKVLNGEYQIQICFYEVNPQLAIIDYVPVSNVFNTEEEAITECNRRNEDIIKMISVKSSNIKAIGHYDRTLLIEFSNGSIYKYSNVPNTIWYGFLRTGSKGKYFSEYIKNNKEYTFEKIRGKEGK